jgi:hypothetical protein
MASEGSESSPGRVKTFLRVGQTDPGAHPWVPEALFPGVKQQRREAGHSPPTSAEEENVHLYTHSPIRLHGVLINYRVETASVAWWSEFMATAPEVRLRFSALPDLMSSGRSCLEEKVAATV